MASGRSFLAAGAAVSLASAALLVVACGGKKEARSDAEKGQTLYTLHCVTCHNPDPSRDGTLGPAVKGSSLELLEARVLHGEYPPGYTPKRPTRIMQKLPLTAEDLGALHAYLNGL
jgi:mono/diheme cytochrome c family protein